ncbi:DUF58 domain-containing protein [bacterium]|nr:DUF58 domain-containing protein [bacterium]
MDTARARRGPIDSAFLGELEGLRVLARKVFRGQMRGERRSRNKGQSVEFVDFRPYIKGDDLRRIDWNLYGRLERYYIKLFEEEEDLRLYILLDCSASMDYGTPNKFNHARKLAAALSYIVLANLETVSVSVFAGDYGLISTPTRGKGKIHPILHKLNALEAGGSSMLTAAAARFAAANRKSGLVCVISDFFTAEGIEAIAPLLGAGHQIELLQMLAPEEANPQLTGDLELIDKETGVGVEVSMGINVMRRYHQTLAALQAELKSFALRSGGDFFICNTATPLKEFILGALRTGRLIR